MTKVNQEQKILCYDGTFKGHSSPANQKYRISRHITHFFADSVCEALTNYQKTNIRI